MPTIVLAELDPDLARTEPDPEIQSLIRASAGVNFAIDYLPGAVTFDPVTENPSAELASAIVWFDAFVTNVDRTARNTNLLMWHRRLWLIDHGAALYFHHAWDDDFHRAQPNALPDDQGSRVAAFRHEARRRGSADGRANYSRGDRGRRGIVARCLDE